MNLQGLIRYYGVRQQYPVVYKTVVQRAVVGDNFSGSSVQHLK